MVELSRFDEENIKLGGFLTELDAFIAKEKKSLDEMEEEYKQGVLDASIESKRSDYTKVLSQTMNRLLAKGAEEKIRYLEKVILTLPSPYFAKITVAYENESKDFYIGRVAFTGTSEDYVITDWRAPVASLYYNNPFIKDNCEYKVLPIDASDSGRVVKGDLKLRR